jgi:hypothetical protein
MSDEIKDQINEIIKQEIQEGINDYLDHKEKSESDGSAFGFVEKEDEVKKLNVSVDNRVVDEIVKEYKRIKKFKRSNLGQIKKLGLVDKHGRPLE